MKLRSRLFFCGLALTLALGFTHPRSSPRDSLQPGEPPQPQTGSISAVARFLLTAGATPLWGQAAGNGQISGSVADQNGAAVANANVTATQVDTGLVRTAVSGQGGLYTLPNLPLGSYKLQVQAGGFENYVQTGITLNASKNAIINVTLRAAQKAKGGFFGGLKSVTGQSSEQSEETASAGTKGVGEGQKIANVTPTAADRQAVSAMEGYSVPPNDLKKFQQDGHLSPGQ